MADWQDSNGAKDLRKSIDWHLASVADDKSLRDRLEGMAASGDSFRQLAWYWAPRLYARNRAMFRPFIQQYFSEYQQDWRPISWKDAVAESLDPWLATLERDGELQLFRRLYTWKHGSGRRTEIDDVWREDLRKRFTASASPSQRAKVLQLFELRAQLDEPTAVQLYDIDAGNAGPFILRHLPVRWWGDDTKRELWGQLAARAKGRGDDDFYFKLYRQQIGFPQWEKETLGLCQTVTDADRLNEELDKRHPAAAFQDLGKHFHRLLEARGRDVVPYVRKHLRRAFSWRRGSGGYGDLVKLAQKRGWVDVWAAVVVICGNRDDYNGALREVLDDPGLDESERIRRLLMLSGVSSEWNGVGWGLAVVQQLTPAIAFAIYKRYPHLIRQSFKAHVTPAWSDDYFELFELAWSAGDDDVADYLASRYVTQAYHRDNAQKNLADRVADKFVALKLDDAAFARRAANVLTLVPAYSIHNYDHLIRENRFARLLFERSRRAYLEVPAAVRDLVEGGEIHVQHLAYRVLAMKDPRAEEQARANLDILIGTLLRPLHRRTRLAGFGALANAASTLECAQKVLARAREVFALPDRRYPKEQVVGLIAKILARFPELAGPTEQPVIYRRAS